MRNLYEWRLDVLIDADPGGARGSVICVGKISPWYSFKYKHRRVTADARGVILCQRGKDEGCVSMAQGAEQSNSDCELFASVEVNATDGASSSRLDVRCVAQFTGSGSPSTQLGVTASGVGGNTTLKSPDEDRGALVRSQGYVFRCA